jgi:hypothetical protein
MKYILTNGRMLLAIVALLLGFAPRATGADEDMVELKTRTATYTNVTVARKDGTNIYIKHDGGMANVKLGELDPDTQRSLGYAVAFSKRTNSGRIPRHLAFGVPSGSRRRSFRLSSTRVCTS